MTALRRRFKKKITTKGGKGDEQAKDDEEARKRNEEAIEDFKKAVRKTKGACTEFFRRVLVTYNRCQVEAEQRLDDFLDHNSVLEMLQKKHQDEEARTQRIKSIDDQILRSEVGHSAVSVQLLEDQLRLSAARVEAIKNQAEKFEINIQFLEPCAFEGIASDAAAWKKFLDAQVGPSS